MYIETTEKGMKKFSKEEKLRILEEAKTNGVKVTLAKSIFTRPHFTTGVRNLRSMAKKAYRIKLSRTMRA